MSTLLAGLTSHLAAQSPIGAGFSLSSPQVGVYDPNPVFYPDGRFLFGFRTVDAAGTDALRIQRYSPLGAPVGPEIAVAQNTPGVSAELDGMHPVLAADGGFWSVWYELSLARAGTFARRYSAASEPVGESFPLDPDALFYPDFVRATGDGRLIILGRRFNSDFSWPQIEEFSSADGHLLQSFAVDLPRRFADPLALFLDAPDTLFAAWQTMTGETPTSAVWGRRFTREGSPLSPPLVFNRRDQPAWANPAVARDGAGNFIAVWQAQERNGTFEDIYAQQISASGAKIGLIFVVNTVRESAQRFPTVAADRFGNFVIVWQSFDPTQGSFGWHLQGQLFRKDGRRVGKEFAVPNPGGDNDTWNPQVVFGPNGTFLLHYVATGPVMVRRYAASPGDEPCVWRGNTVQCDTGRTGGDAELPLALPLFPGDVPLLGDVDGDGRADPCVHRGRKFLCDTEHDGTLDWQVSFGQGGHGEIPLLGDVDGDGRAEACTWNGRQFQCDTAHNGGKAEWTVKLGKPGDVPLLADVDGDGRADPCVFRAGQFLCDTAHNGSIGWKETFGAPGDLPLLGDFDGDGRVDACVFSAGVFLCDTAHDGVFLCDTAHDGGATPPARLLFGRPGDRPLLGNLDGL